MRPGGVPECERQVKRFTATEKWRDRWFRRLSAPAKLLFIWLTDNCDNAGVIDFDVESASFDIGEPIEQNHIAEIQSRLKALPNGKTFIPKFIEFQYGTLSPDCAPHRKVLELLRSHGINYREGDFLSNTLPDTQNTLAGRVSTTLKEEEEEKEEEKDKDKGGVGGVSEPVKTPAMQREHWLIGKLCAWFNRRESTVWSPRELRALRAVAGLQTSEDDFAALETYYLSDAPYRRKDILTLLNNWNGEIDRAKNWKHAPQATKPSDRNFGVGQDPNRVGSDIAAALEASNG